MAEEYLGADFSDVELRNDARARQRTTELGAHAVTEGTVISLADEAPSGDSRGRLLLGHELVHVAQQRASGTKAAQCQAVEGAGGHTGMSRLSGAEGAGGHDPASAPPHGASGARSLSPEEYRAAHAIFGDSLDYSRVGIKRGGVGTLGGVPRGIGNVVHLTDHEFQSGSDALTSAGMHTLIHELTHVWQYQHRGWTYAPAALWAQLQAYVRTGSRNAAYEWRQLQAAGVSWEEWNPEAHAQAIEDYNRALFAANSGTATPEDYDTLGMVRPILEAMLGFAAGGARTPQGGGHGGTTGSTGQGGARGAPG